MTWTDGVLGLANFACGMAVGMIGLKVWEHRAGELTLNRVLAVAIFAVVCAGTVLGVYNAHQLRAQATCQARVNTAFLEALATNTALAAQDRDNLDTTVQRLLQDDPSEDILADYLAERERVDEQRQAYPELPEEVCE